MPSTTQPRKPSLPLLINPGLIVAIRIRGQHEYRSSIPQLPSSGVNIATLLAHRDPREVLLADQHSSSTSRLQRLQVGFSACSSIQRSRRAISCDHLIVSDLTPDPPSLPGLLREQSVAIELFLHQPIGLRPLFPRLAYVTSRLLAVGRRKEG